MASEYRKQNSQAAAGAGWAALGIISLLLGNRIYVYLWPLNRSRAKSTPPQNQCLLWSCLSVPVWSTVGACTGRCTYQGLTLENLRQINTKEVLAHSQSGPSQTSCTASADSACHPREVSGGAFCTVPITSAQCSVSTAAPAPWAAGAAQIKVQG